MVNKIRCFKVESVPDAAKVVDMIVASTQTLDKDEICFENVRLESKLKPRLRGV